MKRAINLIKSNMIADVHTIKQQRTAHTPSSAFKATRSDSRVLFVPSAGNMQSVARRFIVIQDRRPRVDWRASCALPDDGRVLRPFSRPRIRCVRRGGMDDLPFASQFSGGNWEMRGRGGADWLCVCSYRIVCKLPSSPFSHSYTPLSPSSSPFLSSHLLTAVSFPPYPCRRSGEQREV